VTFRGGGAGVSCYGISSPLVAGKASGRGGNEPAQSAGKAGRRCIGGFLDDRTTIAFAGLIEREFGGFTPPPGF
jgi:hypothetical protein